MSAISVLFITLFTTYFYIQTEKEIDLKCKAIPVTGHGVPYGYKMLRSLYFLEIGKHVVVKLCAGHALLSIIFLVLISVRG
jgi:hypothetical protein